MSHHVPRYMLHTYVLCQFAANILFNGYRDCIAAGRVARALNTLVHVVPRLRMSGAATLLPSMPSLRGQEQIYLYFAHYNAHALILEIYFMSRVSCVVLFCFRGMRPAYEVGTQCLYIRPTYRTFSLRKAMPWLRRLVNGVSPRRPGLDPGPVHVKFVAAKAGQVAPRVLRLSPVRIIPPPMPHTHLHLSTSLITRTRGRSLGTFKQSNAFFQISVR